MSCFILIHKSPKNNNIIEYKNPKKNIYVYYFVNLVLGGKYFFISPKRYIYT